jgi:hypothetical protein
MKKGNPGSVFILTASAFQAAYEIVPEAGLPKYGAT